MERIKGVPRDAAQYFSAICEECFELYFNGELVILSPWNASNSDIYRRVKYYFHHGERGIK